MCNFPEAFLTPVTYFNNITVENTKIEEVNGQGSFILVFDQGNSTESNIDWRKWFHPIEIIQAWVLHFISPNWVPDDDLLQVININNLQISLPSNENKNKGSLTAVTLSSLHYRTFDITLDNIDVRDVDWVGAVPVIGWDSIGADFITLK